MGAPDLDRVLASQKTVDDLGRHELVAASGDIGLHLVGLRDIGPIEQIFIFSNGKDDQGLATRGGNGLHNGLLFVDAAARADLDDVEDNTLIVHDNPPIANLSKAAQQKGA